MADVALRFKNNWADEMDLDGLWIVNATWWKEHVEQATAWKSWPMTIYIGTNEEMEFSNAKDYLDSFKVIPATDAEVEILRKLLGTQVGQVVTLEFDDDDDD